MTAIEVESTVRHPLWPELGAGRVLAVSDKRPLHAKVHWPAVGQTSTHAFSSLRIVGEQVDAREALARASRFCNGIGRHSKGHDHTQCLVEADALLIGLAAAGYRVIGFTDLPTLQESNR